MNYTDGKQECKDTKEEKISLTKASEKFQKACYAIVSSSGHILHFATD
jgi:hypothetical protein